MASPQCEDGYTRIANELLEALCRLHLTGNEAQVAFAVIRKTYGWNKKQDWISASQLAEMTGLSRVSVIEALRGLKAKGLILRDYGVTAIQKDYTAWGCTEIGNCTENGTGGVPKTVLGSTENGTVLVPKTVLTKDNKDTIQKTVSVPEQKPRPVPNFNLPHDDPLPRSIRVLTEVIHFQPARDSEPWKLVVQSIPDNGAALAKWRETIAAWVNNGFSTRNVAGMVDWYKSGKRSAQVNAARAEPTKEELKQKEAAKHAEALRLWKLQHPEEDKNEAVCK